MKRLILGIALAAVVFGCKNNDNNQVSDAAGAEIPSACESCDGGSSCCSSTDADAAAKSECGSGGCSSDAGATCPATGKIDG